MTLTRVKKRMIPFLCLVGCLMVSEAISQMVTITESVPVYFTTIVPAIPGNPPTQSYENIMGDIEIEADGGGKWVYDKDWYVTVSKSTLNWDSNLLLDVLRDPSNKKVLNGDTYVQIPDEPSAVYFFESNNGFKISNLRLQHRVRLNGVGPDAGSYSTTVTYTIVDM
ncbi:hypothetical protein JW979_11680 [bacterium]|nr:hypothetical protein [candidate division CSSED10-310 bacterium]